ncbi:MAG: hypothetical protein KOO63_10085 [Bacteroidales bacterium]|nr:hypothetical protein [Candidatus Latescibacterota bacterium]
MRRPVIVVFLAMIMLSVMLPSSVFGGNKKDRVRYEEKYRDPVLKSMREECDSIRAIADSITAAIDKKYKEMEDQEKNDRKVIRFDFSGLKKPDGPEAFGAPFHFPPVPQYLTGTCWCFCTTSFMESEIKRLTGREIKLSEIYTVYWEFVEKARGFIRKRGHQPFVQGAESDGVFIIWEKYGVVPADAFSGLRKYDKHNHNLMRSEMKAYLDMIADKGYWDEEENLIHIRAILDRYLGTPPERFEFEGQEMTPLRFYRDILKVDPDDYVQFISTLSSPFYQIVKFDVPDNWRPTDTYLNIPLDEFYSGIKIAAKNGFTVCIGGDVSEPGYYGPEDAAIVPSFDIPGDHIDQDSRELRIYTRETDDDHCVHLVGYKNHGGRDWFLIKDSARASRHGKHHGYIFYRDDYIKLKMLSYTVHRNAVPKILKKIDSKGE